MTHRWATPAEVEEMNNGKGIEGGIWVRDHDSNNHDLAVPEDALDEIGVDVTEAIDSDSTAVKVNVAAESLAKIKVVASSLDIDRVNDLKRRIMVDLMGVNPVEFDKWMEEED